MERRRHWDWLHAPIAVYELHLGSWQRATDGGFLGYRELAERIADATGEKRACVRKVLQSVLDEIVTELVNGNRIEFRELGVFEVRERAARRAQNPRTLEKGDVPSKRVVKYKVGRLMRERVCDERPEEAAQRIRSERARPALPQKVPQAAPPAPPPSRPNSPF